MDLIINIAFRKFFCETNQANINFKKVKEVIYMAAKKKAAKKTAKKKGGKK